MKAAIMVLILSLVSASAFSKESDESITRAKLAYAEAFKRAAEAVESCESRLKSEPSNSMKKLSIPPEQLKVILKYHSAKAAFACASDDIKEFLVISAIAKNLAEFESEQAGAALLTYNAQIAFKLQHDYLLIPENIRTAVESLPDFQQPFDLVSYAKALGLK